MTTNKTIRPDATEEAPKLRDRAECTGPYLVYSELSMGTVVWPYKDKMKNYSVADMQLSVRSSNGLRRAGIDNLGKLFDVISEDVGLRNIRNLGAKSVTEKTVWFFNTRYSLFDDFEKAMWWQELS